MLDLFETPTQLKSLSVQEYNYLVQEIVSEIKVIVIGEISELNLWQNKFAYITLKDRNDGNITTTCFGVIPNIPSIYKFKIGDIVEIKGYPGIHGKTGRHSLQIEAISKLEEGFYQKEREELIKKLEDEGIIDVSKKREFIRKYNNIALITAVPSQAYNDFIKIFDNRWGQGRIYVFKSQMQGSDTIKSVGIAIDNINRSKIEFDVVIIARGGGSKEDLIPFDNEELVRKLFSLKYPLISAIGHEGDISISDLVADIRASTPSNAAEIVSTPDKLTFIQKLDHSLENTQFKILSSLETLEEVSLSILEGIIQSLNNNIRSYEEKIENKLKLLEALDINNTLKRGFSIITDERDNPIINHQDIKNDNDYNIYLNKGIHKKYKLKLNINEQ